MESLSIVVEENPNYAIDSPEEEEIDIPLWIYDIFVRSKT